MPVYPCSYELHCKVGDSKFQDQAYKQLVGVIVLTRSEVNTVNLVARFMIYM